MDFGKIIDLSALTFDSGGVWTFIPILISHLHRIYSFISKLRCRQDIESPCVLPQRYSICPYMYTVYPNYYVLVGVGWKIRDPSIRGLAVHVSKFLSWLCLQLLCLTWYYLCIRALHMAPHVHLSPSVTASRSIAIANNISRMRLTTRPTLNLMVVYLVKAWYLSKWSNHLSIYDLEG